MNGATGRVRTPHAAKYALQLCKHWANKFDVTQSSGAGVVRFPEGVVSMTAGAGDLTVRIDAEDGTTVERLKDVVARHLDRFAFREAPLPFKWSAE